MYIRTHNSHVEGSISSKILIFFWHGCAQLLEPQTIIWKLWNITSCEISCFLKTTANKLGDQYIVGPQLKSWGEPVSPGPYGCCAYELPQGAAGEGKQNIFDE